MSNEFWDDGFDEDDEIELDAVCCHHHVKTKSFYWVHPLTHCIKISLFILVFKLFVSFME